MGNGAMAKLDAFRCTRSQRPLQFDVPSTADIRRLSVRGRGALVFQPSARYLTTEFSAVHVGHFIVRYYKLNRFVRKHCHRPQRVASSAYGSRDDRRFRAPVAATPGFLHHRRREERLPRYQFACYLSRPRGHGGRSSLVAAAVTWSTSVRHAVRHLMRGRLRALAVCVASAIVVPR